MPWRRDFDRDCEPLDGTETELQGRVLVVEDDDSFREILVDLLGDYGLEVEGAVDGVEALQKLGLRRYDYVITDIKMPGLDGRELIRIVREKYGAQGPEMIAMTAGLRLDLKALKERCDISEVLYKPFSIDYAYRCIERLKQEGA